MPNIETAFYLPLIKNGSDEFILLIYSVERERVKRRKKTKESRIVELKEEEGSYLFSVYLKMMTTIN